MLPVGPRSSSRQFLTDVGRTHPIYNQVKRRVLFVTFPSLPLSWHARQTALNDQDIFLNSLLDSLPSDHYSLIYLTTPPASVGLLQRSQIPAAIPATSMHIEEKLSATNRSNGLFANYQFFTPGIFMGYMALIILVPVLILGMKALNSLQVSYRAFEPEMKVVNRS